LFHDNFLKDLNFINFYITDHFKAIDARRKQTELKSFLLPLKNAESKKYVEMNDTRKVRKEFEGYFGLLMKFMLQLISSSFFILCDRAFYNLLMTTTKHSLIRYQQEGIHSVNATVDGKGFVANIIRSVIDGFNINKRYDAVLSNEICLPQPQLVDTKIIIEIYLLFLLSFYLIFNQVYVHRLKRAVCAYFYPKHERKRILYLYNKMLRQRKYFYYNMMKTLEYRIQADPYASKQRNYAQVRRYFI
jgi:hypothetical protein